MDSKMGNRNDYTDTCVVYFYNLKFSCIYSILYIESEKERNFKMIKAIILDNDYNSKDVVVKFGGKYLCVSLTYFLNSLCRRHDFDYEVKTAHLENIGGEVTVGWFEILSNMKYHTSAIQSCEEFENLWESDKIVDGIDLH